MKDNLVDGMVVAELPLAAAGVLTNWGWFGASLLVKLGCNAKAPITLSGPASVGGLFPYQAKLGMSPVGTFRT